MKTEFSRPQRIDQIGEGAHEVTIDADPAERVAVAARFGLVSIARLHARLSLRRELGAIVAMGRVEADVVQACSITEDPLPATVAEDIALRFVEPAPPGEGDAEVELADDVLDTIEIEGGAIDLGEAAAETMALALDPFPRSPRAAEVLRGAGVITEEEARPANPFAALKGKLGG